MDFEDSQTFQDILELIRFSMFLIYLLGLYSLCLNKKLFLIFY